MQMNIKEIVQRIENIMEEKDMSPTVLAALSGIALPNITRLLNGERKRPSLNVMSGIASALEVSLDYLCYGNGFLRNGMYIRERTEQYLDNTPVQILKRLEYKILQELKAAQNLLGVE